MHRLETYTGGSAEEVVRITLPLPQAGVFESLPVPLPHSHLPQGASTNRSFDTGGRHIGPAPSVINDVTGQHGSKAIPNGQN